MEASANHRRLPWVSRSLPGRRAPGVCVLGLRSWVEPLVRALFLVLPRLRTRTLWLPRIRGPGREVVSATRGERTAGRVSSHDLVSSGPRGS